MTWLRVDDGFTSNKKIVQLTDHQFRVWMRTLCWCSAVDDPTVDKHTIREVFGLKNVLKTFRNLGLLDDVKPHVWLIHDWEQYRPKDATGADRQAKWRANHPVTNPVTPPVTEPVTKTVSPEPEPEPVLVKPLASSSNGDISEPRKILELLNGGNEEVA